MSRPSNVLPATPEVRNRLAGVRSGQHPMCRASPAAQSGGVKGDALDTGPKEVAQGMNDIHQSFAQQGLVRPREGRILGGVCAGLGRRFGIAPWTARILFVLLLMVVPGTQILIYPVLWILMPSEETVMVRPPQTPPAATN
jgi:phage shock protein C